MSFAPIIQIIKNPFLFMVLVVTFQWYLYKVYIISILYSKYYYNAAFKVVISVYYFYSDY